MTVVVRPVDPLSKRHFLGCPAKPRAADAIATEAITNDNHRRGSTSKSFAA